MSEPSIDDVLDLDYPAAPEWSADGELLAVPAHENDGQHLRIASVAEPTDPWAVSPGGRRRNCRVGTRARLRLSRRGLEELQKHGETRWSKDGYIILKDTITQKAEDEVPGVAHFYDHAEVDIARGQDLMCSSQVFDKPGVSWVEIAPEDYAAVSDVKSGSPLYQYQQMTPTVAAI